MQAIALLRNMYPNLLHVTCLAYEFRKVANQIREENGDISDLIHVSNQLFHRTLRLYNESALSQYGSLACKKWAKAVKLTLVNLVPIQDSFNSLDEKVAKEHKNIRDLLSSNQTNEKLSGLQTVFSGIAQLLEAVESPKCTAASAQQAIEKLRQLNQKDLKNKVDRVMKQNLGFTKLVAANHDLYGDLELSKLRYSPVATTNVAKQFPKQHFTDDDNNDIDTWRKLTIIKLNA